MLVNISTGELVSQLDITHEGDANFLEWSFNGNWIFKEFAKLAEIMGMTPPKSPFDTISFE